MTHRTGISAVTSPSGRAAPSDGSFAEKIEELVERSGGQIQADVAHAQLVDNGVNGSPRTDAAMGGGGQASV